MSSPAASALGWCPGAFRPMRTGDGLIVRVKPCGGMLTPEQGIGIAQSAARFGNGALDLTSRANLQIRGVEDGTVEGLMAALDRLGLLDADAESEARRNVVASPLAGLDSAAAFDIRPAVAALDARLARDPSLTGLPAKFGFAVSDGGALPLGDVPADVRFEAVSGGDGQAAFAIRLDGDATLAATCCASAMPEVAVTLARAFAAARRVDPDLRRMRDLVVRDGAPDVFGRAGLTAGPSISIGRGPAATGFIGLIADVRGRPVIASVAKRPGPSGRHPGSFRRCAPRDDACGEPACEPPPSQVVGIAAPFGRLDAPQLDRLARGAASAGATELRLTPWRAILVPGLAPAAAGRLAEACAAAGLIVDPLDPRLRVAACTGAPGCHRGTTPTLVHAARWARLIGPGRGIALHVSGCAKGCAHPGPAPLTLVARHGRYDLVTDGAPGAIPSALGLDADEARRLIRIASRWVDRP